MLIDVVKSADPYQFSATNFFPNNSLYNYLAHILFTMERDSSVTGNMTGYYRRLVHFIDVTSPLSLLLTDKEILHAQDILMKRKMTETSSYTDKELRNYQRIIDATVHPATNQIIPRILRVSAIAPVNVPLVFCMLQCPPSNVAGTLFLHWVNQSYNTACNYANKSGSTQSIFSTVSAYVLAVSSACSFAYGLGKLYQLAPPPIRQFGIVIPCIATVAANVSNLSFTRMNELTEGAPVFDGDGQVLI